VVCWKDSSETNDGQCLFGEKRQKAIMGFESFDMIMKRIMKSR
jgi:hypothetical protein